MADIVRIDGSDRPPPEEPDAHGQAALMLVESLLHALVDRGVVTTGDALAIVHVAQDVKEEVGRERLEQRGVITRSLRLLDAIATSLEADLNGGE